MMSQKLDFGFKMILVVPPEFWQAFGPTAENMVEEYMQTVVRKMSP